MADLWFVFCKYNERRVQRQMKISFFCLDFPNHSHINSKLKD